MDVGSLISSFATGTYTVTRRARASVQNGRAVPGATTMLTMIASIVPASGRELMKVPEGRRVTNSVTVRTTTPLMLGGVTAQYEADRFTYMGDVYEVNHVDTWQDPRSGATMCQAIAGLLA